MRLVLIGVCSVLLIGMIVPYVSSSAVQTIARAEAENVVGGECGGQIQAGPGCSGGVVYDPEKIEDICPTSNTYNLGGVGTTLLLVTIPDPCMTGCGNGCGGSGDTIDATYDGSECGTIWVKATPKTSPYRLGGTVLASR